MKKHIITVLGLAMIFALSACKKDFLNVVPLGSQVASVTEDYDQLMNSPSFYYYSIGGWQEPMMMGDEIAAEAPFFSSTPSAWMPRTFQWQAVIFEPSDNEPFDLQLGLSNLYTYNKVIAEVGSSSGGTDSAKAAIKAEAEATRAWNYIQFINFYAKPYDPSTAATDLGFPIIKSPDISQSNYTRSPVKDVYDFITQDLLAAIPALPLRPKIQTRMSKPAAEGLLGKTYLFMGMYDSAKLHLQNALNEINTTGFVRLYDYNVEFAPGGSFLPIDPVYGPHDPGNDYNDLTEAVVSKVFYNGSYAGNQFGNDGLVITPRTAALYGPTDLRLQLYTTNNQDGSSNAAGRLRKYGVQYSRFGLQLPDLLLLSAEAKARTNDLSGAVTDVETLRKARIPAADAAVPADTASNQTTLIKFIIDERIREFALEGYRWFDMRRLSLDPIFTGQTFTHTLYSDDGTNNNTIYTLDQPNRLTLQLPPAIIGKNPGMPNNP